MIHLIFASLRNRRVIAILTALSVGLSIFLFASVEKMRHGARAGFTHSVSGTHIIVGARSGQIPLLLFSLFHLGSPTSNVSYNSYLRYKKHPAVAWALPLSIGDSHRGFRVVGTSAQLIDYYRYADARQLVIAEGRFSLGKSRAVLGSTAAAELRLKVGDNLVLTHGISDVQGIHDHDESPFSVEGIFEPTGTPFDKGIYVSLESIEHMHAAEAGESELHTTENVEKITSFLIGVKEPIDILPLMRIINEDNREPLTAILPGVVLSEVWGMMSYAENTLKLVSLMVMLTALCGLFIALYASLAERYREMAILRALGASPLRIAALLLGESMILIVGGIVIGYGMLLGATLVFKKVLLRSFAVHVGLFPVTGEEIIFVAGLIIMGTVVAMIPAIILYRRALSEGLQVRQ
jgi:putative ABC transport system permease protein